MKRLKQIKNSQQVRDIWYDKLGGSIITEVNKHEKEKVITSKDLKKSSKPYWNQDLQ